MPTTPETWLPQFVANSTTTSTQANPDIIQLNNGNILVSWTSFDDTGVGSPNGSDIIGQIYDPFGVAIGSEIRLNFNYSADTERDSTIAATTQGGFLVAYVDFEGGAVNDYRIALDRYSATGTYEAGIQIDLSGESLRDPHVAVSSATSAIVAWIEDGIDDVVNYRIYNPSNNTLGTQTTAFVNGVGTGSVSNLSVTTLTNGSYVVAAQSDNGTDDEIWLRIINAAGTGTAFVQIPATEGNGDEDRNPSVTALTGGSFVVVWENTDVNDTDLELQIFNASGVATSGVITVNSAGASDNNNEPTVVELADGGFIIFYDDDQSPFSAHGQRYSSTGSTVGSEFTIDASNANDIQAVLLDDGRVALTWSNGEIQMEILDTRDNANTVLGSSQIQTGTVGNDTFTAATFASIVNAWEGNDVVTASGSIKDYFLDDGDDTMIVVSSINSDNYDGGTGVDLIDWSLTSTNGAVYNLAAGTATSGASTEGMTNFENIIATNAAETVFGTSGANTIDMLGGNDSVDAGSGDDFVQGGNGVDTLRGSNGNDTLFGNNDDDQLFGDGGIDSIDGGAGNDTLFGGFTFDDTLLGGDGDDVLEVIGGGLFDGGADNDTFVVRTSNVIGDTDLIDGDLVDGGTGIDTFDASNELSSGYTINLDAGTLDRGANGSGRTIGIQNVENATGTNQNDTITGDDNANTLLGLGGDDIIDGGFGTDNIDGGAGNDTLFGGFTFDDTLLGGDGDDVLEVIGGGLFDGGADNDTFVVLNGNVIGDTDLIDGDLVDGGTGIDTFDASNELSSGYAINLGAGTLGRNDSGPARTIGIQNVENATGTNQNDTITGDDNANTLLGLGGADIIDGGFGIDSIDGGAGNDTLFGGLTFDDTLLGGDGDDVLEVIGGGLFDGGADNDTFVVADGFVIGDVDLADGDLVDGGTGIDTFDASNELASSYTINLNAGTLDRNIDGTTRTIGIQNVENATGTDQADSIVGSAEDNVLNGNGGNDTLFGFGGNDTMSGNAGNDEVRGNAGNDIVGGESGNDTLFGGEGNDSLYGGADNDLLEGGAGDDLINGGGGFDTADYSSSMENLVVNINFAGAQSVSTLLGTDTFVSIEGILGGSGNDLLVGSSGGNVISGGGGDDEIYGIGAGDVLNGDAGNDLIEGSGGNDTMDGGTGTGDILSYYNSAGSVVVNLRFQGSAQAVGGSSGTDTFTGFENLYGSNIGDDTLVGDIGGNTILGFSGNDQIYGFDGNDSLLGMQGADTLVGGLGADTLKGGGGADVFDFNIISESNSAARDTISDFGVGGADLIDLSTIDANTLIGGNQAFSFIGAAAFSGAGQLRFATNGTNGFVLGDVDGNGTIDLEIVLSGITSASASDFIL